ncbi:hypothetical protein FXO38_22813 [Capsicum annuum]|nr:hypothetical protein FXO37_26353 [Capsicum annuum]KAF3639187.1 hypothetical protein FXO38_22813 [Capsicum annuum]
MVPSIFLAELVGENNIAKKLSPEYHQMLPSLERLLWRCKHLLLVSKSPVKVSPSSTTIQASLSAAKVEEEQSATARSSCGGAIQFHASTANLGSSSISFPMAALSSYLLLGSSS